MKFHRILEPSIRPCAMTCFGQPEDPPSISSLPQRNHADQRRNGQPRSHLYDPRDPSLLPMAALFRGLLERPV